MEKSRKKTHSDSPAIEAPSHERLFHRIVQSLKTIGLRIETSREATDPREDVFLKSRRDRIMILRLEEDNCEVLLYEIDKKEGTIHAFNFHTNGLTRYVHCSPASRRIHDVSFHSWKPGLNRLNRKLIEILERSELDIHQVRRRAEMLTWRFAK
jgi:hypothetical protein